jgi:hypothetical protein
MVTVVAADVVELPDGSTAMALTECEPALNVVVFQEVENGAIVRLGP